MKDVAKLQKLGGIARGEFISGKNDYFDVAKLRLREALEGVFNIGVHILSRIEGGRTTEYKEIANKLGEFGIVDPNFAKETLLKMAGYRNRLTHFYAEITPEEMYDIIQNNLRDFDVFLKAVKNLLERPERFNLTIE